MTKDFPGHPISWMAFLLAAATLSLDFVTVVTAEIATFRYLHSHGGEEVADEFSQILGPEIWHALAPITATRVFGKGETLFEQGSPPQGVHIIKRGQVALIVSPRKKRKCPVELAGPGTVLGLSESVCGRKYQITAEASESTTVSYIERQNLLAFLRDHCDICIQIVRLLSDDLHMLYHRVRTGQGNAPRDRGKMLRRVN